MTPPTLTIDLGPIPLEWAIQTRNTVVLAHATTANLGSVPLGSLWKGAAITAADIQAARKELWSSLESSE